MKRIDSFVFPFLLVFIMGYSSIVGQDNSRLIELKTDEPTLHSFGFTLIMEGDKNQNSKASLQYKIKGQKKWHLGMDLHRVEVAAMEGFQPPKNQFLLSGSLFFLKTNTAYDVSLSIEDPDGFKDKKILHLKTRSEPEENTYTRTLYIKPGNGGGSGTKESPYLGLDMIKGNARAGDLFLLMPGEYISEQYLQTKGTAEHPITIRGISKSKVIIKGGANKSGLELSSSKYTQIENLTITDSYWAIRAISAKYLIVKNCHLKKIGTGVFSDSGKSQNFFIIDNHIEGVLTFPFDKNKKYKYKGELRGVDIAGKGHIVCYNTVHGFRDGIDVRGPGPITGVDFHNNEIYDCYDDGIELDFSDQNVRAFYNRITNCGTGISFQPIHGGPAYAIKNVIHNLRGETFKIHLSPTGAPHRTSGGYMLHNTIVRSNPGLRVWSNEGPGHYFTMYNNLYIGTNGSPIEITCPMKFSKLDHNAYFHDGKFTTFAYWNKKKYENISKFSSHLGLEKNGISKEFTENIFDGKWLIPNMNKSSKVRSFHLSSNSAVIDKGKKLSNINDEYKGDAPDIGALEFSEKTPIYGCRK